MATTRSMPDEPDRSPTHREPRQSRSAATLARILRAAEELASSTGLEEMTMTAVAERAGVAVGTIYRRFEDKEQLVAALTERMLEQREQYVAGRLRVAEPSLRGAPGAAASDVRRPGSGDGSWPAGFPGVVRRGQSAGVGGDVGAWP